MTFSKKYKCGNVIFNQGDSGGCAYIIESGEIEIYITQDNKTISISELGPGEIFGEMAILDQAPRSASAKALTDCELTLISKEQITERVNKSDPVIQMLLTIFTERIRNDLTKSTQDKNNLSNLIPFKNKKGHTEVIDRIRFEQELFAALSRNEFLVYYQPIIDMKNKKTAGVEALMRWNSPKRGFVRPDIFMGIAEESSLIIPIGQWVIKEAFKQFSQMLKIDSDLFTDNPFLSINVSVRQFHDTLFFKTLTSCVKKYKLSPNQVKLEITERVLLEGDHAFQWINQCRELGFSVAIDDFGTGFSSLQNLDTINIDCLKIDKVFIDKINKNKKTETIVSFMVEMSKQLGLSVVAEGIETKEQYELLKKYNLDHAQGYYFSRPMEFSKTMDYLTSNKKVAA